MMMMILCYVTGPYTTYGSNTTRPFAHGYCMKSDPRKRCLPALQKSEFDKRRSTIILLDN
jgi:hypothetical protein